MSTVRDEGVLFVVATPIGNLEDLSARARRVLGEADVICCEDTRHTGQLLAREGIDGRRLLSVHDHNEASRVATVLELLQSGSNVAFVSDAGTPLVSDPGARIVAACVAAGLSVISVPGPSALLAALVVTGFSLERFAFEGFLPRKGAQRTARLRSIRTSAVPVAFYESPQRIRQSVADLLSVCEESREVAICRELTKLHEESWRGTLAEAGSSSVVLAERGEYVVVVAPQESGVEPEIAELEEQLERLETAGLTRRHAIAAVEILLGVAHRVAYSAAHSKGRAPREPGS